MNLLDYSDPIKNDGDITLENLVEALNKFFQRKEDEKPLETKIARKEILVTDRTNEIRSLLKKKRKVSFFDLFEIRTREYVVVTFLSILEMAKEGEITIIQEDNFNNITVNYKEGEKVD